MDERVRAVKDTLKRGLPLTWRWVFNFGPTIDHRRNPPVLNATAQRIVADLDREGVALATLEELTGDPTLLGELQCEAAEVERLEAEKVANRRQGLDSGETEEHKAFVIELLGDQPVVDPRSALGRATLHHQVKGVADRYFGLRTRLADANIWRTLPRAAEPTLSQLWHRDLPEDHFILKSFIYLEDVTEGSGPFWYAPGTHGKGDTKTMAESDHDGVTLRATDTTLASVVPEARWKHFPGPAGTILFADTRGYHRGGWATTNPRLVIQAMYASQSSTFPARIRLAPGAVPADWSKDLALVP